MNKLLARFFKFYKSVSYLLFRHFYTTTHILAFIKHSIWPESCDSCEKNKIIICGAELNNKYSALKIFSLINMIKQKYPDKECYLFSMLNYPENLSERKNYTFNIIHWVYHSRARLLLKINKLFFKKLATERIVDNIAKKTAFMVDLGTYQLSSNLGTGFTANMLSNITFAKKYKIPFYVFPQIVGPFKYPIQIRLNFFIFLKLTLPSIKKIYCLNKSSLQNLKPYTSQNALKSYDFLLLSKDINLKNIYIKPPKLKKIIIKNNSVAIIPSTKVINSLNKNSLLNLYVQIIEFLLTKKTNIYLVPYSNDVIEFCAEIKNKFIKNNKVHFINKDLNCFELYNISKNFKFIFSSNYFSIINAYKNNTPVIALGNKIKNYEILKDFRQTKYYIDYSENISIEKVNKIYNLLLKNYKKEKTIINTKLKNIENKDISLE